jgi:hypothetical protein
LIPALPLLEQTAATLLLAAHGLALLLHDLADLDARIEELGRAAVEADGLALVELALAVVGGNALLLAGGLETVYIPSAAAFLRRLTESLSHLERT